MKIYEQIQTDALARVLERPKPQTAGKEATVNLILDEIRKKGDTTVRKYTRYFDRVELDDLQVSLEEIAKANDQVPEELKQAIQLAAENIQTFHKAQDIPMPAVETMPGVKCWRKSVAIDKVGLYIPGGTAPLFSTVLMLAIPAQLAGCKELVLCTPPNSDGSVAPEILYAARLTGVTKIFKIGGIQAIGAMAYGTESVPAVDKIFGPGNSWVTLAKQIILGQGIAIDLPAGPSELMVIADEKVNPAFVAADLLSQAEHGSDSQVILITFSKAAALDVQAAIADQLESLPRKDIAEKALENGSIIIVQDEEEAMRIANEYAPEHLILAVENASELVEKVRNAGSVFVGNYTPESVGDYASGTNHTLPTGGFAKAWSGAGLDSFRKQITFQELTREGLEQIGPAVSRMAKAEQLEAHANAVELRTIKNESNVIR